MSARERLDVAHHEFLGRQEEVGGSSDATLVVRIVTMADEPLGYAVHRLLGRQIEGAAHYYGDLFQGGKVRSELHQFAKDAGGSDLTVALVGNPRQREEVDAGNVTQRHFKNDVVLLGQVVVRDAADLLQVPQKMAVVPLVYNLQGKDNLPKN